MTQAQQNTVNNYVQNAKWEVVACDKPRLVKLVNMYYAMPVYINEKGEIDLSQGTI